MIYRGFGFITANSPSPQTPNSLQREESRGRTVPRPRLLIFYASHSTTLVREGRRFGIERTGNQPLRRGADFRAQRKPPQDSSSSFFPVLCVRVRVCPLTPAISRKMNFERGQACRTGPRYSMFLINSERGEMGSGSDDKRMDVFGMRVFSPTVTRLIFLAIICSIIFRGNNRYLDRENRI